MTAGWPEGQTFAGKSVIVTGAAGGIGSAIAEAFARQGASVMIADRNARGAEAVRARLAAEGFGVAACAADVTITASVQAMVVETLATFGAIDVLVHSAGLDAPRAGIWELDDELWQTIIDTNLSSAWRCARAVLDVMRQQRSGRIILIGSIAARRGSLTTAVAYNAAKAGIHGLTIGLAKQLEPFNILVNAIAPGPIGTGEPMTADEMTEDQARFPLRIVGPKPVADACLYLAGPSGDWVSGTILNVSGGRWHG